MVVDPCILPHGLLSITHNAAGTIVDHYTHWDWGPLCEAVLAIRLPGPLAKNVAALAAWPFFRENQVEAPGIEPGLSGSPASHPPKNRNDSL